MEKYLHITDSERRKIEYALSKKESIRSIARKLGRSPNTISLEIKNNSVNGIYSRKKAQVKAIRRRKQSKIQCMKIAMDKELKKYVIDNIKNDQTPEGISGRLREVDKHLQYASTKAIYKFVYSVHGRQIEKYLYSRAVKKKGGPKRGSGKVGVDGRIMIDKRSQKVEKRAQFGHFEGDFIESGKNGEGSLLVLVERKTRYPFIIYTKDRTTEHINNLIANMLSGIPVQSITLDNDLSFQKHNELSELVDAAIFFCHPYCSFEKGTVENRNKAIRRYAPKKTDFNTISNERIKEIENKLRNRFMNCLNFKTPQEA
jgi:IS30 family transposase